MEQDEEFARIAAIAASRAAPDERVTGVLAAQATEGDIVFLCSFDASGTRTWLVLDRSGEAIVDRASVREVASLAALCELAEEAAGGGDLPELRRRLEELRVTEAPEGIEDAERAAEALELALAPEPRIASVAYLDALGSAARRLEQALDDVGGSPFAVAMRAAAGAAEALAADVVANYRVALG